MSSSTSAQTRDLSENSREEANKALTNCEYLATGFDLVVFDAWTPVETREYFIPFYPRAAFWNSPLGNGGRIESLCALRDVYTRR